MHLQALQRWSSLRECIAVRTERRLGRLRIPIVSLARSHHIASHHGIAPPTHSSTSAISSTSISINSTTINYLPASICHYNDD